jgi:hypothetical protein
MKGRVFIFESPSDMELLNDTTEGRGLAAALRLAAVPHDYYLITTPGALDKALETCADSVLEERQARGKALDYVPIFHFSCHGNESGLALTDKHFMTWEHLKEKTMRFATKVGLIDEEKRVVYIIFCMSSCLGITGWDMAKAQETCPFSFIVGSDKKPTWQESLSAFITFYHLFIHLDKKVEDAVTAMVSVHDPHWLLKGTCHELGCGSSEGAGTP